jgi:5' nucleotidase family
MPPGREAASQAGSSCTRTTARPSSSSPEPLSSADVDLDGEGDAEQRLGGGDDLSAGPPSRGGFVINGVVVGDPPTRSKTDGGGANNNSSSSSSRLGDLLSSVGLEGRLKHASDLPAERRVSVYDIFCNRELRLDNIAAIGFDMDYTLAQYQQPAFDQLAFDGAKEKLVRKFGYPEEVLSFRYDHEVRCVCGGEGVAVFVR